MLPPDDDNTQDDCNGGRDKADVGTESQNHRHDSRNQSHSGKRLGIVPHDPIRPIGRNNGIIKENVIDLPGVPGFRISMTV